MKLVYLASFFFLIPLSSFAASYTANATTCVNDTSTGTIAWTSPNNAAVADASYAVNSVTSLQVSNFVTCSGFSFSFPSGKTISGIALTQTIDNPSSAEVQDATLIITVNGSTSTNKALVENWGASSRTIGNSLDPWGFSLTTDNFTNVLVKQAVSKAGGAGAAEGDIDSTSLTVYTAENVYPSYADFDDFF